MKLITLPFAGGSAANYINWKPYLNQAIDLVPIELAGRGRRINEPLYADINEMTEDVFQIVKKEIIDDEYVIFGHSMGALLAYELVHKIKKNNFSLPIHIFFSGRYAPNTYMAEDKILHNLPYEEFKKEILEMGGTTSEIFEHPELTRLFLPVLRNDIKIAETYQFINSRTPHDCDFSILIGKEEDYTIEQLAGWRKLTSGRCEFHRFEGGHFFIHEEREKVVELVNEKAASLKLQAPRIKTTNY